MGIIAELQEAAIKEGADVVPLLRKAHLAARKLKLGDFDEWLLSELNGYGSKDVPRYREVPIQIKGKTYHGWIPALMPSDDEGTFQRKPVAISVSEIQALVQSGDTIMSPLSKELNDALCSATGYETEYVMILSKTSLLDILAQVQNRILDWALTLEENGIVGEGVSFSMDEQERARKAPLINYTSNFYGDISDSQIQQGTHSSRQTQDS